MNIAKSATLALIAVTLTACATTPGAASKQQSTLFTRNNVSPEQQVFTDQKCWVEADRGNFAPQVVSGAVTYGLVGGLAGAFAAGLLEGTRKVNAHASCMNREGYTRVAVSPEQAKAYHAAKSLNEKAAILGANSYATSPVAASQAPGLKRTVGRF